MTSFFLIEIRRVGMMSPQRVCKIFTCNFILASRLHLLCQIYEVTKHMEWAPWQDTEGDVWPMVSKELRPSVQHPTGNWILPTTTGAWTCTPPWSSHRWDPSPGQHLDSKLRETMKQRTWVTSSWDTETLSCYRYGFNFLF